jgi:Fe-S-cluster containining protein
MIRVRITMHDNSWYSEGLRFECTQCGNCCTGATGYVWLNKQEIQSLADLVEDGDVAGFERKYVRQVGVRKSLKERDNFDCVLFDSQTRRCRVYAARPRQCRTWPFWDSNLKNPEAWEATCQVCPGSGQGRLYQLEQIDQARAVIRI